MPIRLCVYVFVCVCLLGSGGGMMPECAFVRVLDVRVYTPCMCILNVSFSLSLLVMMHLHIHVFSLSLSLSPPPPPHPTLTPTRTHLHISDQVPSAVPHADTIAPTLFAPPWEASLYSPEAAVQPRVRRPVRHSP
jgi:hypothetical protein